MRFGPATPERQLAAKIAGIKSRLRPEPFDWYPYDSFGNLQHLEQLVSPWPEGLRELAGEAPVGDFGAGDGDLAFWLESLGLQVIAADYPGSNANQMRGIELLKQELGSAVKTWHVDLDQQFTLDGQRFGLAICLGLLYHLKNPVFFLEKLSRHARYCILSTRILPSRMEQRPVAYLAGDREINDDPTNFWFFSESALLRLMDLCKWRLIKQFKTGSEHDERMFCLLESPVASSVQVLRLLDGWHETENGDWRWTKQSFSVIIENGGGAERLMLRFLLPAEVIGEGPVALTAEVNGLTLAEVGYSTPGNHVYSQNIAPVNGNALIRFRLTRCLRIEDRELGLIVQLPSDTIVTEDTGSSLV